jgi:hypothetical protein
MIDETLAQFRARRQNINRYRSLLQTSLTEFERDISSDVSLKKKRLLAPKRPLPI